MLLKIAKLKIKYKIASNNNAIKVNKTPPVMFVKFKIIAKMQTGIKIISKYFIMNIQ